MKRDESIGAVSSINDPTRRAIYDLVSDRGPLARDEVSGALGLPSSSVAFHLERLAAAGLLSVAHERRTGRTGPGAGRPAKIYSVRDAEISVSVPPRHYDLMGDLLADAIEHASPDEAPRETLRRISAERGREIGASAASFDDVLEDGGYHPAQDGAATGLRNCPFHRLAATHRDLVCAANHALLCGAAEATGVDPGRVELQPSPGHCCVRIQSAS
jgi:predicted ArsR family transcriptional regulator